MNKKKIGTIISSCVALVVLAVVGVVGFTAYMRNKNLKETGNILGVAWYNETDTEFTITTAEELYEFAKLSDFYDFRDQTIYLGADIVVNEGNATDWAENAPRKKWSPIEGFAGTFDGQEHSISGIYGKTFEHQMALFRDTSEKCKIQNFSLVNTYFETSGFRGTASVMVNGGGKFSKIYSDAIIVHDGENVAGIASIVNKQASFDECWYDGQISITLRDCGGIIDYINGANVTIKNCLFSGTIQSSYDYSEARTGGIIGYSYNDSNVRIDHCLASGQVQCDNTSFTGAVVGVNYGGCTMTVTDTYTSDDTYMTPVGTGNGSFTGSAVQLRTRELTGVKAYQWTTLDFEEAWAVVEEGTPILKCFAEEVPSLEGVEKEYDLSWYNPSEYNFKITNRKQLYGFALMAANTNFEERIVKLDADIVVNEGKASDWAKSEPEYPWIPINAFAGVFDGQEHTISGLYFNTGTSYTGFFKRVTNTGVVKNFSLVNTYFEHGTTNDAYMGSIAGQLEGKLENVYSNAIVVSAGNQVGGLVGRAHDSATKQSVMIGEEDYCVISNCWFDGTVKVGDAIQVGGILGRVVQGDVVVEHCLNTGTISCEAVDRGLSVAGIVGHVVGAGELQVTDCLNVGDILTDHNSCVGSVIGRVGHADRVAVVTDTYAASENFHVAISTNGRKGVVNGGAARLPKQFLTGYKGYEFTNLDFDKYWVVEVSPEGTPVLASFTDKKPSVKHLTKKVDTSWYSADAKEMVIDSMQDLYGFAIVSAMTNFEGQKVKLGADICMNAVDEATFAAWVVGTAVPENLWIPISSINNQFAGTFDGQGHTISGVYLTSDESYIGLFSAIGTKGTVKNVKLVDSYFAYTGNNMTEEGEEAVAILGSIVGECRGNMNSVYSNAVVVSKANQVGGLVGRVYSIEEKGSTISNCWFDGQLKLVGETARYAGGIVGITVKKGTKLAIKHCLNTGSVSNERPIGAMFLGGILGIDYSVSTITIADCFNAGEVTSPYKNYIGSITGGAYKKGSVYTVTDTYATKESCMKGNSVKTIYKVVEGATVNGSVTALPEEQLLGYGGYTCTTLNFKKYWSALSDSTPVLQTFAGAGLDISLAARADTTWYDKPDANGNYHIKNIDDLFGFAQLVNNGTNFMGKTVYLDKTITVNKVDEVTLADWKAGKTTNVINKWTPIGNIKSTKNLFAGTFDGDPDGDGVFSAIRGVYMDTESTYAGLFGATSPTSVLKNFRLEDSYFAYTGPSMTTDEDGNEEEVYAIIGSVCGDLRGDLDTVYSNAVVVSTANYVGGLVARANAVKYNDSATTSSISNCWFDGEVKLVGDVACYAGGIAGLGAGSTVEIQNCLYTGTLTYDRNEGNLFIGGIIGHERTSGMKLVVTDTISAGKVASTSDYYKYTGSVMGRIYRVDSTITFSNVYATEECYETPVGSVKGDHNEASSYAVTTLAKKQLQGIGGYTNTWLDFEEKWAARTGEVPALQCFVGNGIDISTAVRPNIDWYENLDANGNYHIATLEELYGFASLVNTGTSFAGKTIYLDKPIEVNKVEDDTVAKWKAGDVGAVKEWTSIGNSTNAFDGIFDGQGNSISGIYVKTDSQYVGVFGNIKGATIQNLRVEDSYFENTIENGEAYMGGVVGSGYGNLRNLYSDAVLTSSSMTVGGIIGYAGAKTAQATAITSCQFDGEIKLAIDGIYARAGGIVGYVYRGTTTIDTCLDKGIISMDYHSVEDESNFKFCIGGMIGVSSSNSTVNVRNSLAAGISTLKWLTTMNADNDAMLMKSYGTVIGNIGATVNASNVYSVGKITITINTTADKTEGTYTCPNYEGLSGVNTDYAENIAGLYGTGAKNFAFTVIDRIGANQTTGETEFAYWSSTGENSLPIPAALSETKDTSMEWYHTPDADGNYHLDELNELYNFGALVNSGNSFAGKTIYLDDDIEVNKIETDTLAKWKAGTVGDINGWTPIGSVAAPFDGTFDGQNHTISGIYIKTNSPYIGVFGWMENATIQNLRVEESYFEHTLEAGVANMGSVVGGGYGTLKNLYSNAFMYSVAQNVGGIIGYVASSTPVDETSSTTHIVSCWFDGEMELRMTVLARAGGIAGYVYRGVVYVDTCMNEGTIDYDYVAEGDGYSLNTGVAGIIGVSSGKSAVHVRNSLAAGEIDMTWQETSYTGNKTVTMKAYGTVIGSIGKTGTASNVYSIGKIKITINTTNAGITTEEGTFTYPCYAGLDGVNTEYVDNVSALHGEGVPGFAFSLEERENANKETKETETAYWAATGTGSLPIPAALVQTTTR